MSAPTRFKTTHTLLLREALWSAAAAAAAFVSIHNNSSLASPSRKSDMEVSFGACPFPVSGTGGKRWRLPRALQDASRADYACGKSPTSNSFGLTEGCGCSRTQRWPSLRSFPTFGGINLLRRGQTLPFHWLESRYSPRRQIRAADLHLPMFLPRCLPREG